jgi:NAD+ kinase
MEIKKVGILYHPLLEATSTKAQELKKFLISRGVEAWECSAWETDKAINSLDGTDLLLTTGGDGTILRAAQVAFTHQTPIVGINMGNLGFLTELKANEALDKLPELLNGRGWLDERTMLEAELVTADSNENPSCIFYALNDVVLARGAIAKLVQIDAGIDGKPLTTYRADGVILSTPTGSTGYSLAAGGPVIYPQSGDILLVPIVPHLGWSHSLVLPSASVIKLQIVTPTQATLSIDGHINLPISSGAVVTVKQSTRKTRFLRLNPPNNFFHVLEEKLRGKK